MPDLPPAPRARAAPRSARRPGPVRSARGHVPGDRHRAGGGQPGRAPPSSPHTPPSACTPPRLAAWDQSAANYAQWITSFDTLGEEDRTAIRQHVARLPSTPRISILMATHDTPERLLRHAVDSVRAQLYPH